MTDVFLSYSRKDTDYVRTVFDRLQVKGQKAWVDWRGIEYSTKWWEEICAGIEGADNFVLFVSMHSLNSRYCHQEIAHALSHSKRIIAILCEPIDEQALVGGWYTNSEMRPIEAVSRRNWEALKSIQWIDRSKMDNLDSVVEALLHTVATDMERVQRHTRLLLRIQDWERSGRSPAALLHGEELAAYEDWRTKWQDATDEPKATKPQLDYIAESRRSEDAERAAAEAQLQKLEQATIRARRNQRRAWGATIVAVPTILVAILAVVLGLQANTRVNSANATLTPLAEQILQGNKLVEAQRLSALAVSIPQSDDARPVALLALRSLQLAYTSSADETLLKAITRLHTRYVLNGHTAIVMDASFAPDGRSVVSGDLDGIARLWDATTGQQLRTFAGYTFSGGIPAWIWSLRFSPDGKLLILGTSANVAPLYDVQTGKLLHVFKRDTLTRFYHVAFAPDGQSIVIGSADNAAQLWSLSSGQIITTFTGHTSELSSVVFSADGKSILTGSYDHTARLWDISTGQALHVFEGHDGAVRRAVFSPDGKSILTVSDDKTAKLWDIATGRVRQTLTGHTEAVNSAAFSPAGDIIATVSDDNSLRLWSANNGALLDTYLGHKAAVNSVEFSPDGSTLVTTSVDTTVRIWNLADRTRTLIGHSDGILDGAFSADGKHIVTASLDKTVRLWDVATGRTTQTFAGHTDGVYQVEYAPDGKTIMTVGGLEKDGSVRIWDLSTGQLTKTFSGFSLGVLAAAYAPDGQSIVTVGDGIYQWGLATETLIRSFTGHSGTVSDIAFAPDGKTFVTAGQDQTARLWDTAKGSPVRTYSGHTGGVLSVAFSRDGTTLITSSDDKTIRIWDVKTGEQVRQFIGHSRAVNAMKVSPDGKMVASRDRDGVVLVWDLQTGQTIRTFNATPAYSAAFSPDSKRLLVVGADTSAMIWDVDYRDTLNYACTRLFQDFSEQERTQYRIQDAAQTCPVLRS
jgi:WD40 repeat protein